MAYRPFTPNHLLINFLSRIRSKRTDQVRYEYGCAAPLHESLSTRSGPTDI